MATPPQIDISNTDIKTGLSGQSAGSNDAAKSAEWRLLPGESAQNVPVAKIADAPVSIGRKPGNTLQVPIDSVSGQHAQILAMDERLLVKDLGSTNGTFINGHRINEVGHAVQGDIIHFGTAMYIVSCENSREESRRASDMTVSTDAEHNAIIHVLFDRLLSQKGFQPHYQPIINLKDEATVGYEVLCRSNISGLRTGKRIFELAEERGCADAISELLRRKGTYEFQKIGFNETLYLNTHPVEFATKKFFTSLEELRQAFPDADLMLEVHECAVTSISDLQALSSFLRDLSIGLAFDDFGAGQSRLTELVEIGPSVVKFDRSLVVELETSPNVRKLFKSLLKMFQDVEAVSLAEGIESQAQLDICCDLEVSLGQGFFLGYPVTSQSLAEK